MVHPPFETFPRGIQPATDPFQADPLSRPVYEQGPDRGRIIVRISSKPLKLAPVSLAEKEPLYHIRYTNQSCGTFDRPVGRERENQGGTGS